MPPSNLVPVAAWRDCREPAEFPVLAFRVGALGNECGTAPERSREYRQTQLF